MFASFSMFFLNHLLYSKCFPVLCISSQSILMHLVRHPFYFKLETLSGSFRTCPPTPEWIGFYTATQLSAWEPHPQFAPSLSTLERLRPLSYVFFRLCFAHSCWRDISTASCREDAKTLMISQHACLMSENAFILT